MICLYPAVYLFTYWGLFWPFTVLLCIAILFIIYLYNPSFTVICLFFDTLAFAVSLKTSGFFSIHTILLLIVLIAHSLFHISGTIYAVKKEKQENFLYKLRKYMIKNNNEDTENGDNDTEE